MGSDKNYDDIINLPHHISKKHKQMSMEMRAAQFAPYAALSGYGDGVKETARLTDKRIEQDETKKGELRYKLEMINEKIKLQPEVTVTFFVPDKKKAGRNVSNAN